MYKYIILITIALFMSCTPKYGIRQKHIKAPTYKYNKK